MPRPRHLRVRRRASVRVDSESPHSNNESDTISPEVGNWGGRRLSMGKSKRRSTKPRPGYNISQSEDDDDELVFTPVQRRCKGRNAQNQEAARRMYEEPEEHPEDSYSIRRSTRQRKLKYDNYNDSWIVGSQTVKGYPCYVNTSHSKRERLRRHVVKALPNLSPPLEDEEEEVDEREEDEIKEEQPRRMLRRAASKGNGMMLGRPRRGPSRPQVETSEEDMELDESKEEPPRKLLRRVRNTGPSLRQTLRERTRRNNQRIAEESSEDMDIEDLKEEEEERKVRSGRRARPPQRYDPDKEIKKLPPRKMPQRKKPEIQVIKQEPEVPQVEENEQEENEPEQQEKKPKVEKTEDDEGRESDSSSDSSRNKDAGSGQDQNFQDMYARVKQRRRNNTTRTPITGSGEDSRHQENSANKSDSESSSGGMSEGMVGRTLRRPSQNRKTYHLRQVKPAVNRFQVSQPKIREVLNVVRRKRPSRRRRWSSSSSSSDSSRDERYDRKKSKAKSSKSMALAGTTGSTNKPETTGLLADVDPLALDTSIRFSNVGGLESHIDCLKEMVVFPMLYKDIFERFNVTPPKGVLFHGPPGTGKTLMARALANECSQGSRKVSFFMRKGADCLSKWVGESERQLRLLFEEAKQARPSIIFFDELDGLAPVRSAKQDQIHASIVCTLLALMDGLDNRGDIIVIGATNRIDSIDPALRRPGRFDRELYFPLPGLKERREILGIHTKGWSDETTLNKMAEESWGYCGSDLKALCSEAILQALKRVFPQIYQSSQKLKLDPNKVKVERLDFMRAKRGIVPASKRGVCCMSRRLPKFLEPLLNHSLNQVYSYISSVFPHNGSSHRDKVVRNPRLVLTGEKAAVMSLASALLHKLEHCSVLSVSLESIHSEATVSPEEAISRVFKEVPQRPGAVLWIGDISLWWDSLSDLSRSVFIAHVDSLDSTLPVLFLAVSTSSHIPSRIRRIFSEFHGEIQTVSKPTEQQKRDFFTPLLKEKSIKPPILKKKTDELETLPVAPPSPPRPLTKAEEDKVYFEEENTLRELRIFLRQICSKLARNKQFYMFSKPVDINEVPDYLNIINEPMDLETMMTKIDLHKYTCAQDFLNDVDLLCRNALEYNPDKDPEDKLIRHRACYLVDTAYALIKAEMDSDFEISCRSIRDKRKDRGYEYGTARFVKEFFPDHQMEEEGGQAGGQGHRSPASQANPTSATTTAPNTPNHQDEGNSGGGSGCLNSENKKRKRKITSWSKGLIKKKKTPTSTPLASSSNPAISNLNQVSEGSSGHHGAESADDSSAAVPTVHSTPLKTPSKKCKLDSEGMERENETDQGVNADVADEILANGDISSGSSDLNEPLSNRKIQDDSIALTEHSFHTESNNSGGEKQLLVDYKGLESVLEDVISLSLSVDSYKSLIDLYIALERIVHSYLRKWNRTNLVKDLRDVLQKYTNDYRPSYDDDSCSGDETEHVSQMKGLSSNLQKTAEPSPATQQLSNELRTLDNISTELHSREGILTDINNDRRRRNSSAGNKQLIGKASFQQTANQHS